MHITDAKSESALQCVAKSLAQFENPQMTSEIRHALSMNLTNQEVMGRLCDAVAEYGSGSVKMHHASDSERTTLFTLEVLGPATYMVLESDNRVQPVIITSGEIIFDSRT